MERLIVGLDIGGTKIAGGLVAESGILTARQEVPTGQFKGFEHSSGQMHQVMEALLEQARQKGSQVIGIGACAPGPMDPRSGILVNPPNLLGWENLGLRHLLEQRYRLPARVDNDANAAGLAEALWGAAAGFEHVFYVTVSTGIGTGIVVHRRILHGKNGMAGEGGHVSINAFDDSYRCNCGNVGCIEAYASGPSTAARARRLISRMPTTQTILREEIGDNWEALTMEDIGRAAAKGDAFSGEIIRETGVFLGIWLGGVVSLLDPDIIVIGGGVSQVGEILFEAVRAEIPRRTINRRACETPVVKSRLGRDVGIFGAAALVISGSAATPDASY